MGTKLRVGDFVDGEVEHGQTRPQGGDGEAGGQDLPPGTHQDGTRGLGVVEHDAPADHGRIAEPQELQGRLGDDGVDDGADEAHPDDGDEVGQYLHQDDAPGRFTQHLGGDDELLLPQGQGLGADDPGAIGPGGQPYDEGDHHGGGLSDEACQHQQQGEVRDHQHHVHQEGEALVHHAAEVAGGDAHRDGQGAHQQACPEAHHQGDAGAVGELGPEIVAHAVGTHHQLHAGGLVGAGDPLGGFVAGEQRGEQGHQHEGDHDGEAEGGLLVTQQDFQDSRHTHLICLLYADGDPGRRRARPPGS